MNRYTRVLDSGAIWPTHGTTEALNRLAAYEDTGLEPEEVAELVKAKADGRLVALPCKAGDTVYTLNKTKTTVTPVTVAGIHYECKVDERYTHKARKLLLVRYPANCGLAGHLLLDDFGVSWFLTREAAEAALKGEKTQ